MKSDSIGKPGRGRTPRCDPVLLGRKGQAGNVGTAFSREAKPEPAPAGADIEHLVSRVDQQLCGDVPFFVELRRVEILCAFPKVGARILPVAIEKQLVELI